MPFCSSLENASDNPSSSNSSVVSEPKLGPNPGMDLGRASTRVFVRGLENDVVVVAVGGGGGGDTRASPGDCGGIPLDGVNLARTSVLMSV
jgi:hypothetical protein